MEQSIIILNPHVTSAIKRGVISQMMMLTNTSKIDANYLIPISVIVTSQLLLCDFRNHKNNIQPNRNFGIRHNSLQSPKDDTFRPERVLDMVGIAKRENFEIRPTQKHLQREQEGDKDHDTPDQQRRGPSTRPHTPTRELLESSGTCSGMCTHLPRNPMTKLHQ